MKALSLWQPWATLVVAGEKRVETRGWATAHRGPLLIHAAKAWNNALAAIADADPFRAALLLAGFRSAAKLPFGALVGTVEVVDCYPTSKVDVSPQACRVPSVGLDRLLIDDTERAFGDYGTGRWAWLLRNPVAFAEPVPHAGRQKLFEVRDAVAAGPLTGATA